jgi:hypothetical protein
MTTERGRGVEQHDRRKPDESQLAWFARTCLPGESEPVWFARMHPLAPQERRQPNEHEEEWFERTRHPNETEDQWYERMIAFIPPTNRRRGESEHDWYERTRAPGESVKQWFARVRSDVPSNMRSPAQKNPNATAMTPRQKKWVVIAVAVAVMWIVGKVALDAKRSSSPVSDNVIVTSSKYYEYCVASGYRDDTELKDCEDIADTLGVDPSSHP